jgi:hypothetical protein
MKFTLNIAIIAIFSFFLTQEVFANANYVKEEREIQDFSSISIITSGNVFIRQGKINYLRIEGNADAVSNLITEVVNGTLRIRNDNKRILNRAGSANIFITFQDIEALSLVGSADIKFVGNININNFELKILSSGDIDSDGIIKVPNISATLLGSGDISFNKLLTQNIKLRITGSGDFSVNELQAENMAFEILGSGDIKGSGKAISADVRIMGSGDVRMMDMAIENLNARIMGTGNIGMDVQKNINSEVMGSGRVRTKSNPQRFIKSGK